MNGKFVYQILLIFILMFGLAGGLMAEDKLTVNSGVDIYNRYVWRGLDIAATPSMQPSLSLTYGGFEFGAWGAYTLSNQSSEADEIDFWLSYTLETESGVALSLIATDYYFPNAGIKFFNFNDYDAVDDDGFPDPGAHTIEVGLSVTGPKSFPITVAGYVNVYNDAGNNTYFQADYPLNIGGTEVNFFCGMTTGSEDNSDYYGTDEFKVINVGASTGKDVKLSESFTLPLTFSFIVNPNEEIAHFLVGMSL